MGEALGSSVLSPLAGSVNNSLWFSFIFAFRSVALVLIFTFPPTFSTVFFSLTRFTPTDSSSRGTF